MDAQTSGPRMDARLAPMLLPHSASLVARQIYEAAGTPPVLHMGIREKEMRKDVTFQ